MDILELEPKVKAIALSIYHRLPPRSVCLDDLIQEGWIGAIKARQHFDESRGVPFRLYATRRIRGEILDYLRRVDPLSRQQRRRVRNGSEVAPRIMSIDAPLGEDTEEGFHIACEGDQRIVYADIVTARLLRGCTPQARIVLHHYFTLEWPQRQIAVLLGVHETRVNHILTKNLERMRVALGVEEIATRKARTSTRILRARA